MRTDRTTQDAESDLRRLAAEGEIDAFGDPAMSVAGAEGAADDERIIRSGRLAGKGLWQSIWILAVPVLLQQLMAALLGTVDTLLAGNLPLSVAGAALDGVGFGASFMWVASIVLMGLGIGAQAIIARAMGAGTPDEARTAGGTAVAVSAVAGLVGAVAVWFAVSPVARWMGMADDAHRYGVEYVRVVAVSLPLMSVMTVGGMALHGAGETARPSSIATVVNVVNVLCSWLLSGVVVEAGSLTIANPSPLDPQRWGVWGVAAGTSISYAVGGLWTMWVLSRGVKDLRVGLRDLHADRTMLRRIISLGIPNMLEGATMWLTTSIGVTRFIGMVAESG
ncbi:MAG: MATE family efflux transporter, partial [Phycisphaerales bacterium]